MIYSFIFSFLCGMFLACEDTFENENFFKSIFKNYDQKFWYKRESWKTAKHFFSWKFDSWHISKSLMIISFLLCGAFYPSQFEKDLAIFFTHSQVIAKIIFVAFNGIICNLSFNLFYNYIFRSEK